MKRIKIRTNDISFVSIFIAFFCATNGNLTNTQNNVVYYLPFVVCLCALVLEIFSKHQIAASPYVVWRIVVLLLFMFSTLYAIDVSRTVFPIKRYILQTFVVVLISKKCLDSQDNIKRIIRMYITAVTINLMLAFSILDITALKTGQRLGKTTINYAWNANSVGIMAAFAIVFTAYYYLFIYSKRTMREKIFCGTLIVFFSLAMTLSGSRKSIIAIAVALLCYMMISSKLHIVRNIIIAFTIIFSIGYLLYNIPFLYDKIGYRLNSFFEMLQGGDGDKSLIVRQAMVEVGLAAFWDRPLFGYGINCFMEIFGAIGREVYAHNNYIELMVDVGIVGLVLYYGYLVYLFIACKSSSKNIAFIKSVLLAILACDFGMVSYYDSHIQYILCIVICILIDAQRKHNFNCRNIRGTYNMLRKSRYEVDPNAIK